MFLPPGGKRGSFKGLVRPVLDYGSSVWDPPGVVLQEELCKSALDLCNYNYDNWEYDWHSWYS